MNTNIFKNQISLFVKLIFMVLAIGAFSLAAQAGSLDVNSSAQSSSNLVDFADQQNETLQSVQPNSQPCGSEQLESSDATAAATSNADISPSWQCTCCYINYACCLMCKKQLLGIDTDAS